jgi:hypothetical protein
MGNVKNRLKMNGLLFFIKLVDNSFWEKYSHIENRMNKDPGLKKGCNRENKL